MSRAPAVGRRSAGGRRSRFNLTTVLAVLVPAATVGALALVHASEVENTTSAPEVQELERADLGCPSALSGSVLLVGSSAVGGSGTVELRELAGADVEPTTIPVSPPAVTRTDAGSDPVVVTGLGDLAPGLVATRVGGTPLAAARCPAPQPETWFVGLGARAGHSSVLELANPDVGAAVVDVDVYSARGPLDVPDVRGIRVPGRTTLRIDLAQTVPRRGDIGVRVGISRGRATVTALDQVGDLGGGTPVREWIPGQPAAAEQSVLLGLPPGRGTRTLSLLNPGLDEARVTVQVVAPESVFAPAGVEEIRLRPGSTGSVRLDRVLAAETRKGATGLLVTATEPIVAGVASYVEDDLSVSAQSGTLHTEAVALLPRGEATLLLAGATTSGAATVVSLAGTGKQLASERVELGRDRSQEIGLPRGTVSVSVRVERTSVVGSVLVTGDGATVLPLVELERFGYVPGVRPALP